MYLYCSVKFGYMCVDCGSSGMCCVGAVLYGQSQQWMPWGDQKDTPL